MDRICRRADNQEQENEARPPRGVADAMPFGMEEDERPCSCSHQERDQEL
jgi:hypothetical protein